MRWIKLFEEFSDTKQLSPVNTIYLKFLIESFLEGFKRVDKKSSIDIVKKNSWRVFNSSVAARLNIYINNDGEIVEQNLQVPKLFKWFEIYLKDNIGNNYKSLLSYKKEVEIKYSSRRELTKPKLTRVYKLSLVRYLLYVRLIEKFLPEFKDNSFRLVNHSIFYDLTQY